MNLREIADSVKEYISAAEDYAPERLSGPAQG